MPCLRRAHRLGARVASLFVASLLALQATGCYRTWDIRPAQVAQLDGYRDDGWRELRAENGDTFHFDKNTKLRLYVEGSEKPEINTTFESIRVAGPRFMGVTRDTRYTLFVDLRRYERAQAETFSAGATIGSIAIGTLFGVVAVVGLSYMGFALSR